MKKEKKLEKTKSDELEIQLKKALSDYQNLKRDMDKRLAIENLIIRKTIMKNLISLADDIDVALDHVDTEKGWKEGVSNILNKFHLVLGELGGKIMEVKEGDEFDSEKHEAVGISKEGKDNMVVKIVQNGYMLGDVVVRPARVIVCKKN